MTKREALEIINYIETKDAHFDSSWYYHGVRFNKERIESILTDGIKCAKDLGREGYGVNGDYYISVSKDLGYVKGVTKNPSAFLAYTRNLPVFIIEDKIKAIKTKEYNLFGEQFRNTIIPYRISGYSDEFHVYKRIQASHIIGMEYCIGRKIKQLKPQDNKSYEEYLLKLKAIVQIIENTSPSLPILDYEEKKEIDKSRVLSLKI